eukprot:563179-Rhodomonas_salina.1
MSGTEIAYASGSRSVIFPTELRPEVHAGIKCFKPQWPYCLLHELRVMHLISRLSSIAIARRTLYATVRY